MRGTLAMKMIEKEKSRKATFQKRKIGIMKKAYELSTLCGVDCCLVVYSPNPINDNLPEIWPRDHMQVRRIIDKYKSKTAETSPKKYNVTEFFRDRKNKVEVEACKLRQERLRKLYPTWDFSTDNEHLRMFVAHLGDKIKHCKERINMLEKERYIEGKQQEVIKSSSGKSSASASNRSHLNFRHNNNNSNSTTSSAHHHQTLDLPLKSEDHHLHRRTMPQPFYPNLMPWMMITHNNDSTETTQNDAAAIGHYDLMMRESYCPPPPPPLFYSNDNNSSYYPYLQNSNPHEENLQVNDNIPAAPPIMQEFQSYNHFGNNQHDLPHVHRQKFNYMDPKK